MLRREVLIRAAALLALAAGSPTTALAQNYPIKPIELVVTTSAGSGGDVVSRAMAEIVRKDKLLPQLITVNNRVGGAGVVGSGDRVSKFFVGSRAGQKLAVRQRCAAV